MSSTATTASHLTSLAALTPALTRNDVTLSVAGAGGMAARVELLAPDGKKVLAAARSLRGAKPPPVDRSAASGR